MAMITRVSGNAMFNPVVQLMTHVINQDDSHQILQTDLSGMESLLQDIAALFRDQQKAQPEIVKVWLQLLHNCLAEAKYLLHRSGRRQRCVDCIVSNPRRPCKQIKAWNAVFDRLYHVFQSELTIMLTSLQFLSSNPLYKEDSLHQGVATASGFVGSGIIDAEAQVKRWLNKGNRVHLIGVYGMPSVGKTSLLKMLYNANEVNNVFDRKFWVRIREDYTIFDLQRAIGNKISVSLPDSFDERKMKLSEYLKKKNFLLVLEDLWSRLDLQEVGVAFGDGKHSKVLFSTSRKDLIGEMGAEESIEIQPLSTDEGWMLFRRLAFKDDPAIPMDIEERAMRFAEECMGVPLAIKLVAAMIGQTPVDEWDACFSLLQKNNIHVDPSFPAAHPRLLDAPQLYTLLRWSYDALPNSNLKNCFLYCAMYQEDEEIDTRQLVEMWIGEGLVKSKQGTHLMDMAIGRSYLKLLIDRCFFHIVKQSTNAFPHVRAHHDVFPSISVHHALIREMAVYIAQKEENCLLMGSQNLRNFPQAHYENCRRISFPDGDDLPADLRCPNLSTLILQGNTHVKELPSQFLGNLTSLRVLNLSGCTGITSVPSSVGQLTLLQFLSLSKLPIEVLPEEVCHLSELQFLDLSRCEHLKSLPSQIGQLRNLKHLNLDSCLSLHMMIPREMSELTSLSRLHLWGTISVEMEAPASIWSLKGLKNLTELKLNWINTYRERSRIKDGIMGTWSEMRHLSMWYHESYEDDLLPEDMQNMKKLRGFWLYGYKGLSLFNCKFEHLEIVRLNGCRITKLCPLERLPNLKILKLAACDNLRELGMGSPGAYVSLQKLVLKQLFTLERLDGASPSGEVWDERTLPQLSVLRIRECPSLERLPRGVEKLQNLCAIFGSREWWEGLVWDDGNMKTKLQQILRELSTIFWVKRGLRRLSEL